MRNLQKEAIKQINQKYQKWFKEIETEEGLKKVLNWHDKQYKGNEKQKIINFLQKRQVQETEKIKQKIETIKNAKEFGGRFVITVEWKKSYMWDKNPRATTNYGHDSGSIGGCGYCKLSTATAKVLNQDLRILKLLYAKKNAEMNKYKEKDKDANRQILGYGSGYGILPYFEGGVGIKSHKKILETVGLKMECITSTANTDVYMIERTKK